MHSENKKGKKKKKKKQSWVKWWAQMNWTTKVGPMSLTPHNQNFFGAYFSSLFFDLT